MILKNIVDDLKYFSRLENVILVAISSFYSAIYSIMLFKNFFSLILFICFFILFFLSIKGIISKKYHKKEREIIKDFLFTLISQIASGNNIEKSFKEYFINIDRHGYDIRKYKIYKSFENIFKQLDTHSFISIVENEEIGDEKLNSIMLSIKFSLESGGNLSEILYKHYETVSKFDEIEEEIYSSYADKRLEAFIMVSMVPIFIILVKYYNSNYFNSMYKSFIGIISIVIMYIIFMLAIFILKNILEGE